MIDHRELKHLKRFYMYDGDELISGDIVKLGSGWGYIKSNDMKRVRMLNMKDLRYMYSSKEEALNEQLRLDLDDEEE